MIKKSLFLLLLLALMLWSLLGPGLAVGQDKKALTGFQGNWKGAIFKKDPRAIASKKQAAMSASLDLTQNGGELKGEYFTCINWGGRCETGQFTANLAGNAARLELESGWGGKVVVSLSLRQGRLDWKIIQEEGENYFPDEITLRKTK